MTPAATYVDPHMLTTGDSFEDSRISLTLVVERDGKIERTPVPLGEALSFDNAYDHYVSSYGPLDGSEGAYYTR